MHVMNATPDPTQSEFWVTQFNKIAQDVDKELFETFLNATTDTIETCAEKICERYTSVLSSLIEQYKESPTAIHQQNIGDWSDVKTEVFEGFPFENENFAEVEDPRLIWLKQTFLHVLWLYCTQCQWLFTQIKDERIYPADKYIHCLSYYKNALGPTQQRYHNMSHPEFSTLLEMFNETTCRLIPSIPFEVWRYEEFKDMHLMRRKHSKMYEQVHFYSTSFSYEICKNAKDTIWFHIEAATSMPIPLIFCPDSVCSPGGGGVTGECEIIFPPHIQLTNVTKPIVSEIHLHLLKPVHSTPTAEVKARSRETQVSNHSKTKQFATTVATGALALGAVSTGIGLLRNPDKGGSPPPHSEHQKSEVDNLKKAYGKNLKVNHIIAENESSEIESILEKVYNAECAPDRYEERTWKRYVIKSQHNNKTYPEHYHRPHCYGIDFSLEGFDERAFHHLLKNSREKKCEVCLPESPSDWQPATILAYDDEDKTGIGIRGNYTIRLDTGGTERTVTVDNVRSVPDYSRIHRTVPKKRRVSSKTRRKSTGFRKWRSRRSSSSTRRKSTPGPRLHRSRSLSS